jgi:hypothetical protein
MYLIDVISDLTLSFLAPKRKPSARNQTSGPRIHQPTSSGAMDGRAVEADGGSTRRHVLGHVL